MRKALTFLLASVLYIPCTSAPAQEKFKDDDPSHWASQALNALQAKGVFIGYPDGYFRGKRTLTRYEFAVALDRALKAIGAVTGPAGPPGDKGEKGEKGETGERGPAGLAPEDVALFKKAVNGFHDELSRMGVNIAQANRRLDTIASDVASIRNTINNLPKVWGGAWLGYRADLNNGPYIDYDGRIDGLQHEQGLVNLFELGVNANIPGGAKLSSAIHITNYNNFLNGNYAIVSPFLGGSSTSTDVYLDKLTITTPFTAAGKGGTLDFGRVKVYNTPLTFWKNDTDRSFDNPFIDDGRFRMDGADIRTKVGSVGLHLFGGQLESVQGTDGTPINSPWAGASSTMLFNSGNRPIGEPNIGQGIVDQLLGLHANVNVHQLHGGHIGFTAMDARVMPSGGSYTIPFSGVHVLGSDAGFKITDRLTFNSEWAKTITHTGQWDTVNPHQNNAFIANFGYASGPINLNATYRYIDPLFYAPGYWGHIGNWINPVNIQGPSFRASYDCTPSFGVNIGGGFFTGARNREGNGGIGMDDHIDRALAGLRWNVSKNFQTTVDWEEVFWCLMGSHSGIPNMQPNTMLHPTETYVHIGTALNLTSNTQLKLRYTIGDYDGHNALGTPAGFRYNFNTFTSSVSVRF